MNITKSHLEGKVDTINRMLGYELPIAYSTDGAIVLSGAYGGTGVHRYSGPHGGVSDLMGGHYTKREAGKFLDGMIHALRILKEK